MVQLNKDEHVWVCFEMARLQNAYTVQRLWPDCWPGRRGTPGTYSKTNMADESILMREVSILIELYTI